MLYILLVNAEVNVHAFVQLADDADNYLPQSHKDPPLAATNVTTSRDDTDKAAASLFLAKGKQGLKRDDDLSSVTSLELQTKL